MEINYMEKTSHKGTKPQSFSMKKRAWHSGVTVDHTICGGGRDERRYEKACLAAIRNLEKYDKLSVWAGEYLRNF